MNITIFETKDSATRLEPISLTRPVFDLRCGAFTFLERIRHLRPNASISLFVREELEEVTRIRFPDCAVNPESASDGLWIDGGVIWQQDALQQLEKQAGFIISRNGRFLGANLIPEEVEEWVSLGGPVQKTFQASGKDVDLKFVNYLWDCINGNGEAIQRDSCLFQMGELKGRIDDSVHLLNQKDIYVGERSQVRAGVILDGESGPLIICENVVIQPGALIEGPAYIGANSLIKAGARIFGETTIGPGCKVGGEVAESILQGWSNKQHDGFLGHAYLGEWVNLGAGTNNSDLKNNYTPVQMTVNGERVDTHSLFVGLFMGDHSKSAIGTQFNTGTVVGPGCNVVTSGFPPRVIPPFTWVVSGKFLKHKFHDFVETATIVKGRRGETLTPGEKELLSRIADKSI